MVSQARSLTELAAIELRLAGLPRRSVDSQTPLLAAVTRARSDVEAPYVALSPSGTAALFARTERRRVGVRVAYRVVGAFRARVATVVNDGIVGDDPEWCVQHALGLLGSDGVDAVHFHCLRVGSEEEAALLAASAGMTVQTEDPFVHLEITVDAPYDELVARRDSRSREAIRRARRKVDALGARHSITRWPGDRADADALLAQMDEVAAGGYQRGLGVGFERDPLHEELVRAGLAGGWFRAWTLSIDDAPAAFWSAFAFGDRWTLYETAFAEAFAAAAPGAGLLSTVVQDAASSGSVRVVGFGLGDARYKRDWADREWMARDVIGFAPRLKWRSMAAMQRGTTWSYHTVRRVLGEDRVRAVKRWLRARARNNAQRDGNASP